MSKVGAVFCVYEDCGFLEEAINRCYYLVDAVVILSNTIPWRGEKNQAAKDATMLKVGTFTDPDNKIVLISRHWKDEAEQRNYGTRFLHGIGISWHFIIDDDELYNAHELRTAIKAVQSGSHAAYLMTWQIYWKNRETVLDTDLCGYPTFVSTEPGLCTFTENRMVVVHEGRTWYTFEPDVAICHHLSYVRTDETMFRKISTSSHANEMVKTWYEEKWLKWEPGMTDLHPTNPSAFRGTLPASQSEFQLTRW